MKLKQDTKYSIMMVVVAALLLQGSFTMEFVSTRRTFNYQLTEMAQNDLTDSYRIAKVRQDVENATRSVIDEIEKQANEIDMDTLQMLIGDLVHNQDQIVGVSFAYLPEYVPQQLEQKESRYAIYIFEDEKDQNKLKTIPFKFEYTERPWYVIDVDSIGYWTEPYEGYYNYILMFSFTLPIKNTEGKTVALVSADVPLRDISQVAMQFYESQRKSLLRNLLFSIFGTLLLTYIVWRAITYLRSLNRANEEKEHMTGELNVARKIQQSMIPKQFPGPPERNDVQLYASLTPARQVGGDLYDFLIIHDRLCFCIGDVSGKGMPAAMLMTVIKTLFRTEARNMMPISEQDRNGSKTATIMGRINRTLCNDQTSGFFATMFVGILNLKTGLLCYCNAGHEVPILIRKRFETNVEKLNVIPNLPVGVLPDWAYQGQATTLNPQDTLFIFTDGLSEAYNAKGEMLSRQRVMQIAQQSCDLTPRQLVELMENEAHKHAGNAEQSDDLTLLAIKWEGTDQTTNTQKEKVITTKQNNMSSEEFYKNITNMGETVTLMATSSYLPQMKDFMLNATERAGLSQQATKRVRLAVEEAVANVVHHSKAETVTLVSAIIDNQLQFSIIDDGIPFDPTTAKVTDTAIPADKRPIGGLGIIFMRQMSDGLEYHRYNGHNILTIKKNIQ